MNATYILRALTETGEESFYTGRASAGWISANSREAFAYSSIEAARAKATTFNARMALTGQRFIAIANTSRYS